MPFTHKTRPSLRSHPALALPFDDSTEPLTTSTVATFPWHRCPTMWNPQGPHGSPRVMELILAHDPIGLTAFGAKWWDPKSQTWRTDHAMWMERVH